MIDNKIINESLKIKIVQDVNFDYLDLIDSSKKNVLSFLDNSIYLNDLNKNQNISGVLVDSILAKRIKRKDVIKIICDDARYSFFSLYNYLAKKNYIKTKNKIASTAKIDKRSIIGKYNIVIGKNVVIEPNVTIYPDVYIGDNCIIKAGATLGCDGYELKRTKYDILTVVHDGKLIIKNNVYIGNNTSVYKGFSFQDTIIGEETKIDNLVYIAHSVVIGKRCFIVGKAMISGSTTLGDNVWVGPQAIISNKLTIGNNAQITLGSVVTQNVSDNQKVSGNFSIEHKKFIKFIKSIR